MIEWTITISERPRIGVGGNFLGMEPIKFISTNDTILWNPVTKTKKHVFIFTYFITKNPRLHEYLHLYRTKYNMIMLISINLIISKWAKTVSFNFLYLNRKMWTWWSRTRCTSDRASKFTDGHYVTMINQF